MAPAVNCSGMLAVAAVMIQPEAPAAGVEVRQVVAGHAMDGVPFPSLVPARVTEQVVEVQTIELPPLFLTVTAIAVGAAAVPPAE